MLRMLNRLPTSGTSILAFISYKHEDMRWAKWLQQQIETYRLPGIIRKQAPHLPKHIRPVFRDQTDISTGPLLQNLRQELEDSRYLIVLCSPVGRQIGMGEPGGAALHRHGPGGPDHSLRGGGHAQRR